MKAGAGWISLLLLYLFLLPISLESKNIKYIVFKPAIANFELGKSGEVFTVKSNEVHLKLDRETDLLQAETKTTPTLTFYRFDENSSKFLNIDTTNYFPSPMRISKPREMPPLVLKSGKKIDISKEIPVSKCLIYKREEPLILVYEDINSSKRYIDIEINSSNDKEIIRVKRLKKEESIYVGYINTTTKCQVKCDGKLFVQKGDSIDVTVLDDNGDKRSRSNFDSVRAKVYIERELIKSTSKESRNRGVWVDMQSDKRVLQRGDFCKITVNMENRDDTDVEVVLQNSLIGGKIEKKSLFLDRRRVISDVESLDDFRLRIELKPNQKSLLSFVVRTSVEDIDSIIDRVKLFYNGKVSNEASVKVDIREDREDRSVIVGKIEVEGEKEISPVRVYLDSGEYTYSDKRGRFHFKNVDNSLHVVSIDPSSIKGEYIAVECEDSFGSVGSGISRFVDNSKVHIGRVRFCLKESNLTDDLNSQISYKIPKPKKISMPAYTQNSFKNLGVDDKIIWPKDGFVAPLPSIKAAILHKSDERVVLYLDGKEVDKLNYDGFVKSKDKKMTISKYRGVDIKRGDNLLEAKIYNGNKLVKTLKTKVHFSTAAVRAEIIEDRSYLMADGKNPPVIAVKFYDSFGYPLRRGMVGEFTLSKPYILQDRVKLLEKNPLLRDSFRDKYTILDDGIAYIELMPTTVSGEVKLHFPFQNENEYLKSWLKSSNREWLIVGFAEGSVAYEEIERNLKKSSKKEVITDGKVSLFAKGSISADTLLTIAYNSHKSGYDKERFQESLKEIGEFGVYGDNSIQRDDAPSSKKLYLKIEKSRFYALFGDFETSLNSHELGRYDRRLTGVKSEYKGDRFEFLTFYSQDAGGYKRVEITPDGTSGPYRVDFKGVVPSSQKIYIESRDRYRSEIVIDRKSLSEVFGYSIDYERGEIYFKEPISRRDTDGNPQTIVVEYEVNEKEGDLKVFGGRGVVKGLNGRLRVGSSAVYQERSDREYDKLNSVDLSLKLLKNTLLNAEVANSSTNKGDKRAYLIEVNSHNRYHHSKAYYRYIEDGFGISSQLSSTQNGVKKYGIDSNIDYFKNFALRLSYFIDESLLTGEKSDTLESMLEYKRDGWLAILGYRYAKSNIKEESSLSQIVTSMQKSFFNSKLKLSLSNEWSLGKRSDKRADRRFAELSYRATNNIEIFANNEILNGRSTKTALSRVGLRGRAWKGASLESSVANESKNDLIRSFSFIGLNQNVYVDENLSISASVEREDSIKSKNREDDYSAYAIGANYKRGVWIYNGRVEYRDGESEDKVNLDLGVYTEVGDNIGVAFGIRESFIDTNLSNSKSGKIRSTLAYRGERGFTLLYSGEYEHSDNLSAEEDKFVNRFKSVFEFDRAKFSAHYGIKYLKTGVDGESYDSLIDNMGFEFLYRLNKKLEAGISSSLLHDYDSGDIAHSIGGFLGYDFYKNLYLGLGYNFSGYYDKDLSENINTAKGAYLKMRVKFDNESLKMLTERFGE
jgi:hypothetical protein